MQIGVQVKKNELWMTNSVDPDETARYEPSHLDLHYLQRYLVWFAGLKGLNKRSIQNFFPLRLAPILEAIWKA